VNAAVSDVLLLLNTCPNAEVARHLARALVEERFAACVNLVPGLTSIYRWQGQIEESTEVLLLIKTTRERLAALEARLSALHPYELPELIVVEIDSGLTHYLDWVRSECAR
jgi:periplasmic divalent cation tolerance protein